MDPAFPLLEYFCQAKYIPYDTEHFLEARGQPAPLTFDTGFGHSSRDIANIPLCGLISF
jgi:hypothetical protein